MVELTVRYFAGARAAAGVPAETVAVPGAGSGTTVAHVLDVVRAKHGANLTRVLAASSFLLDGIAVRDHAAAVSAGAELDVLPPFAGG
ncbi:MoaD/ThiS family protein [Actinosynnema mirum]|uniref:ThiamineS protein n=1 Tax=Actinosynnema mirum (strain ATCC 29888 / DSM 43827 / JCM 3225 / NBRC 14064 / NCIMB 13271 / NRRL B-12336 / IMRU 3971 / 101) TaxID=446462 RepID=C6WHY6_ACTMD|nr:MoaD/ThiS family protein [Actinosynnema mirum]ACU34437.1 thiamineS protein [Actinosynnema mirum DSM 43827]